MSAKPSANESKVRTIDQILEQRQTLHLLLAVAGLEVESLAFDSLATLVFLSEPLVDDRSCANGSVIGRIVGIEELSAPERILIFIKGVLCRLADETVGCYGSVVKIASDILSDLECVISTRKHEI